ncbi:MAG: AAA family ATPase [Chloroflexota bacterium]|nr:AAA family ATPase [Chloroflexota bacterium]
MKIELRSNYLSINELECPELPEFTVLTGQNGAGKTHLLQALQEGHAVVHGIEENSIELYDLASFRPNAAGGGHASIDLAKSTARHYLEFHEERPLIEAAREIYERFKSKHDTRQNNEEVNEFDQDLRRRIMRVPDFFPFPSSYSKGADTYDNALKDIVWEALRERVGRVEAHGNRRKIPFGGDPVPLISMAMKQSGKLPHELIREDIIRTAHYAGNIIENKISRVFAEFKLSQYEWAHTQFEIRQNAVSLDDLLAEYHQHYPPPWDTLRDVMARMREVAGENCLFDFDFSDPAHIRLGIGNFREFKFGAKMTNRTTGEQYDLITLSSGEKILMTLCLAAFNQRLGGRRPNLLLLDELDAMLHPSMIRALVEVLMSLFVEQGSKVVMTTHSPITVAALPEAEVFRVDREGAKVRLVSTSAADAVEELSEGLATVDAGLRIAALSGKASVTILTEGHNTWHLQRWVELHFPQDVQIFDKLPAHTNKSQLFSYGLMLGAMQPETHFVVVWDCDASKEAQKLREQLPDNAKVTPFAFCKRDNQIAKGGIENNYEEDILTPFSVTISDNDGRELSRNFDGRRKTEFADHVRQNGDKTYFKYFEDLRTLVAGILDRAKRSSK